MSVETMTLETMIVLAVVVSAFGIFAFTLERASRQSQKILRDRERRAQNSETISYL